MSFYELIGGKKKQNFKKKILFCFLFFKKKCQKNMKKVRIFYMHQLI